MAKPEQDIAEYLKEAARLHDPDQQIIRTILIQNGLLPYLVEHNLELIDRLAAFLSGRKRIMLIAGESGMGKSLMGADIRMVYQELQTISDPDRHHPLTVITWDRAHKAFFNTSETEFGIPLKIPSGETHVDARIKVSRAMHYTTQFVLDNFPNNLILIESPFFGQRGEQFIQSTPQIQSQSQMLVMHSSASRAESLGGRDLETSGPPQSMREMREVIKNTAEINSRGLSAEAEDEEVKNWWLGKLQNIDGMVVEWNPDNDRNRFNNTRAKFQQEGLGPDIITPRAVSRYLSDQFRHIIDAIPNPDDFLKKITY